MSDLVLPFAVPMTEFVSNPATGKPYNGTCGQTALTVALGCAYGVKPTPTDIVKLTQLMSTHSLLTAPNGACTLQQLSAAARLRGITPLQEVDYEGAGLSTWKSTFLKYAAHAPIVVQVANGQALKDSVTHDSDEIGLHYHAFVIVGIAEDGSVICVDGDHPEAATRFQQYTLETIAAAQPCAFLVLPAYTAPKPPPTPSHNLGDGWVDNGQTLVGPPSPLDAKTHHMAGPHFRATLLKDATLRAHLGPPVSEELAAEDVGFDGLGPGVRQIFLYGALGWTPKNGVMRLWTGVLWARAKNILPL